MIKTNAQKLCVLLCIWCGLVLALTGLDNWSMRPEHLFQFLMGAALAAAGGYAQVQASHYRHLQGSVNAGLK